MSGCLLVIGTVQKLTGFFADAVFPGSLPVAGLRAGVWAGRGEREARAESQTSPFAEGVWQDGGQVYDVHPRGQGADRESGEQLRERARQDAKRG